MASRKTGPQPANRSAWNGSFPSLVCQEATGRCEGRDRLRFGGTRPLPIKLVVEAETPKDIRPAQARAYRELERRAATVFDHARRAVQAMIEAKGISSVDVRDDAANHPLRLRLTDPRTIHVLRAEREGIAYVGLQCRCAWDNEHGLGVLVHGTDVVAVDDASAAFAPSKRSLTQAALVTARARAKTWAAKRSKTAAQKGPPSPRAAPRHVDRSDLTQRLDGCGDRVRVRELVHREKNLFWRIELSKQETYARFVTIAGKVGEAGSRTTHAFDTWPSFALAVRKAINAQLRRGYTDVTPAPRLTANEKSRIRLLDKTYGGPARAR